VSSFENISYLSLNTKCLVGRFWKKQFTAKRPIAEGPISKSKGTRTMSTKVHLENNHIVTALGKKKGPSEESRYCSEMPGCNSTLLTASRLAMIKLNKSLLPPPRINVQPSDNLQPVTLMSGCDHFWSDKSSETIFTCGTKQRVITVSRVLSSLWPFHCPIKYLKITMAVYFHGIVPQAAQVT